MIAARRSSGGSADARLDVEGALTAGDILGTLTE